ncbi:FAD-dependent oxidoreductase [Moorella naiadis]|uniref:FAD-dependent oxidoreductase n=1 Tax=Moorella naiadis (nom. illeg.) TaxID=3093670 RepID=UPI003D9CA6FC
MLNTTLPVAVLGAGIAGVQAALDLTRLGHRVFLLERAIRPGGKLSLLPKTFPTNDCSACAITPPDSFFCIRSPHFIKQAREDNITLLTDVEVRKLTGEAGGFTLHLFREGREEELKIAAIILCPGYEEFLPPSLPDRYGYGRYPGVVTGLELEQRLAASGYPQRPGDNTPVQRVAFIQCAGSRDPAHGVAYCSAVCCMYALKEALMLYEAAAAQNLPLPEITLFYMDLRTYGQAYEDYLSRARQEYGLQLVRSRIHSIIQTPANPRLTIRYALEDGPARVEEFDLAVLATGLRPPDGAQELAAALGIELDPAGFCLTPALVPASTSRPGIFVAGAFNGPCDVIDAVTQGSAAAATCAAWLQDKESSPKANLYTTLGKPTEDAKGSTLGSNRELALAGSYQLSTSNPSPPTSSIRVGIFICTCDQLAAGLDLDELEEYCRTLPGVARVQKLSLCGPDADAELRRAITASGVNRVVVAACSARALEPVLRGYLVRAGLAEMSIYKVVNLLDHAVRLYTSHPELATRKARDLVRMALASLNVATSQGEEKLTLTPAALVIGGGIAGMVAALTLGDLGYEVHLVEKERRLGGHGRRLGHTLTGADVQAYLKGLDRRLTQHPYIHLHLDAKIITTAGHPGGFRTEIEIAGERREIIGHGVTILATGAGEKKPQQYLYDQHPAVVTGLELEDLLKNPARLAGLEQVVFIQCVHSRDADHPYCSRTCCSETIKNALELKKINPAVQIYVLNRDIMTYGLQEEWYTAARSQGVLFLRYQPENPPRVTATAAGTGTRRKVQVRAYDSILGEEVIINADLLVLATGMEPRADTAQLASLFQVPLDDHGFFATSNPKLKPVETPVPGVLTCGLAAGPKNLEETIASARAAAGKAAILARESYTVTHPVARVEGACAACLTCVRVCPHGAPAIKDHRSHIDPLLCQGCGACVVACPAGAITLASYSQAEVAAALQTLNRTPEEAGTVIFTCSYCAYANFENAAGIDCQDDVSVLQVPCLSRIGTLEVLQAVEAGARQIVLTGCVEGQCHFRPARNYGSKPSHPDPMPCQEQAWRRARQILDEIGFDAGMIKILRLPPPIPDQGRIPIICPAGKAL